jgi:hypothetical protein
VVASHPIGHPQRLTRYDLCQCGLDTTTVETNLERDRRGPEVDQAEPANIEPGALGVDERPIQREL